MGILRSAREALLNGSIFVVLESPAQHFVYDIDSKLQPQYDLGNYSGAYLPEQPFYRGKIPGACCRPINNTAYGNYRNEALINTLNSLDPIWRTYVGWLHFYDITQKADNVNLDESADCTHIAYSSYFLDPMWQELEVEIIRLDKLMNELNGTFFHDEHFYDSLNTTRSI